VGLSRHFPFARRDRQAAVRTDDRNQSEWPAFDFYESQSDFRLEIAKKQGSPPRWTCNRSWRGPAGVWIMDQKTSEKLLERSDHALIFAGRVKHSPVFSKTGERLGHIDDLSIDKVSGKVVYAIMSFGGFLHIGEQFHPMPWSLLEYDAERGGYVVPLDRAALEAAPYYDRYEIDTLLGGPDHLTYGRGIYGFYGPYGPLPYW
jgi:hypothetical protein